uniref:NADH dehydrogenase subunit 4L n=1 Tax=Pseudopotamilla reniformis TaxID=279639 RepID=UPI001FAF6DB4|nr:NADH dehydrogenase subunit 4L [Pseudopotamilla reniformis]ULD67138.1 NADH dehydrogenase subunit 4L [Pseudopotamilla reniformis]
MMNYLQPQTVPPMMIILSLLYLTAYRGHLLMILLFFETIVLMLIILTGLWLKKGLLFSILILLTFGACEASIGLSLLVLMSRTTGSDFISSLNLNKT